MDALPFVITGISIPLLLFTVFGNFLVFVIIAKNKKLQNVNTYLISILSAGGYVANSLGWQYCCQSTPMNATNSSQLANVTTEASGWFEIFSAIYIFVLFASGLVLPSAEIIFCYFRVIFHVWFNIKERATNHAAFRSRRKLTKLFIILTKTFLCTSTPTFGRPIVTRYGNEENDSKYQLFSMLLALLGSAANPVIYFRCPRFREEVIKLLTCCCSKRKRSRNGNNFFVKNSFSLKESKKERSAVEPVSISIHAY